MTSERLQQIEALYQLVRGQSAAERAAFLAHIDPDLRREVESLLARDAGDEFRDPPVSPFLDNSTLTILGVGASLGPYRIENMLGEGGMGLVYRAVDTRLGRAVAIKTTREQFTSRFGREARTISSLNHPNICTLYDVGPNYLVMELVEGETIAARLKNGPLPLKLALLYASQIVSALAEAHEKGIIHRDLKPGNIMIAKSGVKVLDFGLAKSQQDHTLTASHMVMGTPAYMAPEQREGRADACSDIYSFGCVFYEMLTGARATSERKGIPPPQLERIISRCLEEDPTQRWASAARLGRELELVAAVTAQGRGEATVLARRPWMMLGAGLGLLMLLAIGGYEWLHEKRALPPVASQADWTQLTDFADSAVSPALSPDGHILTFIRGGSTFYDQGQIYAKLLPNGEPTQLTHDSMMKMDPRFSPDGSTIAYATLDWHAAQDEWSTWIVPALGGAPRLMLPNAEGLTWIDGGHLLFSEIKTGLHMALVTATDTRDKSRDIYVPPSDRGMAHRSALSPDHKWVLVAEMANGGWLPCRLVPFDGSTRGKPIGPLGARCTYAVWSPDQKWMYMSSDAGGRFHIWRQRFPDGELQQVTSGVTEEEGIAVAPDGRSLITSVGSRQSTLWVRDGKGERQVSSEGYAANPQFSPNGKELYYLTLRESTFDQLDVDLQSGELWVADLETGQNQHLLPNFLLTGYSISHDGTEVVFSVKDEKNHLHLWLASLDLRFPPREFPSSVNEDQPRWDASGHIYFRAAEGKSNYVYRMKADGSDRTKVLPDPILELQDVSPDGHWALVDKGLGQEAPTFASSLAGGGSVTVCPGLCIARWTSDGGTFSIMVAGPMGGEDTLVVPVSLNDSLPALPSGGLQTRADMDGVRGAKVLDGFIIPGPKAGVFASSRQDVHRNLYRIPIQ